MEQLIDFQKEGVGFQKNSLYKIILQYGNEVIVLPVNPEMIRVNGKTLDESTEVLGIGEINILKGVGLKTLSLSSFFPTRPTQFPYVNSSLVMWRPVAYYINLFNRIRKNTKPCRIIIPPMLINTLVSIDKFDHWEEGGDEDRWYELELKEWKDYSPQEYKLESNGTLTIIPKRTEEINKFTLFDKVNIKGKLLDRLPVDISNIGIGGKSVSTEVNLTETPYKIVDNLAGKIVFKHPRVPYYLIHNLNGDVLGWVHETTLINTEV